MDILNCNDKCSVSWYITFRHHRVETHFYNLTNFLESFIWSFLDF
jgi:hypothetical protein